jgi:hypothetical protein
LNTSNHNNTLDPSPRYFWPGLEDLEEAQQRLQVSNLVFTVTVPLTGPIFEQINTEFIHHCQTNNIDYLASTTTSATGPTPNIMPWVLLGPKGRSGNRCWVEDPKGLTKFAFIFAALRASPFNNTPNHLGEGPLIFIGENHPFIYLYIASILTFILAPRLRNLYGPIDSLFTPMKRLPD